VLAGGARRAVLRLLRGLEGGRLELVENGRALAFGPADASLRARVEVRDPRAYQWMLRGSTGLGEGYVDGLWTVDDLVALNRIACRSLDPFDRWRRRVHPVVGPLQRGLSLVPRNTRTGAARNISAHYDLGNRLFESFLDERLMYSCAYWPSDEATLSEAQGAKLERICERLELGPDDHLLEIGTGWGGLAIHAASTRRCRVTTTTISAEQYASAAERVREAGLSDRVELLLSDCRDLAGTYDKLVSIEMIEAVGWQYFPAFFSKCAELTRAGGAMFLQTIVIRDDLYEQEKASRSFSNKHIFPGGCLPSVELIAGLADRNGMPVSWSEEISPHYVRTLAAWRERFNDAWPELRRLGYDERFKRLWDFYLASSEAGFAERRIRDVQMLLAKPGWERWEAAGGGAQAVSSSGSGRSSPGQVPVAR
jgi:cyclopropane-fatty-acyl-phospholipid synthase